jgi:uncharacterized membrane protein
MGEAPRPGRRTYIDLLRGVAVLAMVLAHTADAWTAMADRRTRAYRVAILIGGFGAPAFLFLAGVTQSLAAGAALRRGVSSAEASVKALRHGFWIFGLAFLFELQSFVLSGGSFWRKLTRVDILHVMGLAMCLGALLWTIRRLSLRAASLAVAGIVVSFATPLVVSSTLWSPLPDPLEFYLRPVPGRAIFTLFPWAGFFLLGGAFGLWLDSTRSVEDERHVMRSFMWLGLALAAGGYIASLFPSIYSSASFWTTSPAFFFIRIGILLFALSIAFWLGTTSTTTRTLAVLGASSLFVYWIHVEMVYGLPSLKLHHSLSFAQGLAGYVLMCAGLTWLVLAKRRWEAARAEGGRIMSRIEPARATHSVPNS